MRLNTKEKRLQYRAFYIPKGEHKKIDMPEIQLQAFTHESDQRFYLTLFTGTAGKPDICCWYRSEASRDAALTKAIENRKKVLSYKAEQKEKNKGHLSGAAATAAAIRSRLKKEFPGVKFSVTSKYFSMGNSVDIRWTDGPMDEAVSRITDQYEYGRFDGMQDLSYNVEIDTKGLGCPGAKYVHTNRRLSEEYRAQLQDVLEENFTPYHGPGHYAPFQWTEAEKKLLGIAPEPEPDATLLEEEPAAQEPLLKEDQQPLEVPQSSNVIDFAQRKAKRDEERQAADAIDAFTKNYLPAFSREDIQNLLTSEDQGAELARICMRIDAERQIKTH